jgi:hypothetical protein
MGTFKDWTAAEVAWRNAQVAAGKACPTCAAPEGVEKEADLHDQIYDFCRGKGWIALHSAMSERTTRNKGEWDYTILGNAGRVWFIECKSRDGKLTAEQHGMIVHAITLGHTIHVVRSMEDFRNVVTDKEGPTTNQATGGGLCKE